MVWRGDSQLDDDQGRPEMSGSEIQRENAILHTGGIGGRLERRQEALILVGVSNVYGQSNSCHGRRGRHPALQSVQFPKFHLQVSCRGDNASWIEGRRAEISARLGPK